MNHHPVQPAHLQQIRQLNELFLELVTRQARPQGLSAQARRALVGTDRRQLEALAELPRALFQLNLKPGPPGRPAPDAMRAFHLTVLLVAFHMVRDSDFAARVLFAGSAAALAVLARAGLADLITFSARADLMTSPLLETQQGAGRLLVDSRGPTVSRHARIALVQAQSMVGATPPDTLGPAAVLSRAN